MRNTLRSRNRWFSVVAMTCLSGFALSGCTSGSRDLSSSLSESAGREAIEAERHVAERKKLETGGARSKELLASKSRAEKTDREQPEPRTTAKAGKSSLKSAEFASQTTAEPTKGRAQLDDTDLATADWAGDYLDRRVQTVSGDEEEGVAETAEPLLDRPRRQPAAEELFEEGEATVKVQKSTPRTTKAEERPGRASFDGTSEHPWSQKSPTATRSTTTQTATRKSPVGSETAKAPANPVTRVTSTPKSAPRTVNPGAPDEARQAEAKARVESLLTQSKSLLNKGEHRSAFRVAQLAQRIADSENLFFAAGEEQPADLVRSVLMKIRSEDKQVASKKTETGRGSLSPSQFASRNKESNSRSDFPESNQVDDWSYAEWRNEQPEQTPLAEAKEEVDSPKTANNPWEVTTKKKTTQPVMRISPGAATRGSRFNEQFPKSRPEWRGTANEPQSLSGAAEEAQGLAHAKEGRLAANQDAQAKSNASTTGDGLAEGTANPESFVPGPFPDKNSQRKSNPIFADRDREASEPLAVVEDWRTQNLNNIATDREPLLVAPVPPTEPIIPSVLSEPGDEIFAVEAQEPLPTEPQSKLWMILAAAAGAFAMLFVRRRPVPVVRSSGEVP